VFCNGGQVLVAKPASHNTDSKNL